MKPAPVSTHKAIDLGFISCFPGFLSIPQPAPHLPKLFFEKTLVESSYYVNSRILLYTVVFNAFQA